MQLKRVNPQFSVSDQVTVDDLATLRQAGVRTLICNRPDGESGDQPAFEQVTQRARQEGMEVFYLPVVPDRIDAGDVADFERAMTDATTPVHAFCRTGNRSFTLWSLMQVKQGAAVDDMIAKAGTLGYDFSKYRTRFAAELASWSKPVVTPTASFDVVVVGGGSAGITIAQCIMKRARGLSIAIVEPSDTHHYQPGYTLVGGGTFSPQQTRRPMSRVMPEKVSWLKDAVTTFLPESNQVQLASGNCIGYGQLVVCPGLKLDWEAVEGLKETLGKNGVTSNYDRECASYTWKLVSEMKSGKAVFTQPPMPIKCAGAPQKALYLSGSHWLDSKVLDDIEIDFYNAGGVLFGVKDYVPALQNYIDRYRAEVHYGYNLKRIDGPAKIAWFEYRDAEGNMRTEAVSFDMIHVCPPQTAPDFIRSSPLADAAGWVDVDQETLQHSRYPNIWALGDVVNTPNAKTAAAVRKQAPVVATNLVGSLESSDEEEVYDGYGSCPLTVEKGKVVLAEFGYGGKLLPTFPLWLFDGRTPTWLAWQLKATVMPMFYWMGFLKGNEWLIRPVMRKKEKV